MSSPTPDRILQRLEWTVIRRLDGILQGDYRSLFQGSGLDLAELREYQYGDDVRRIDWNVTARMVTPYVRQYLEDREIAAWFLLDLSPSVDFGTVDKLKRTLLIDFVTVMARVFTRHGNRVGAIFFDSKVERVIPAGSGQMQVLRLLNDLLKQPKLKRAPLTDLGGLIDAANRFIRRRSLIFIVSDFISSPGWDKSLGALCQRHEVTAVRLTDPREIELPDIGTVIIEDSETGDQLLIDTHDKRFRQRYQASAEKRELQLYQQLGKTGVDALELSTEDDMVKELVRFVMKRKRFRRFQGPSAAGVLR